MPNAKKYDKDVAEKNSLKAVFKIKLKSSQISQSVEKDYCKNKSSKNFKELNKINK